MKPGIATLRVQLNFKIFSGSAICCNIAEKPDLDFSAASDRQNASFKDLQDCVTALLHSAACDSRLARQSPHARKLVNALYAVF
jgi:hypothetical protein